MDSKNWAHRQALVAAWELWDSELESARVHIEQDSSIKCKNKKVVLMHVHVQSIFW